MCCASKHALAPKPPAPVLHTAPWCLEGELLSETPPCCALQTRCKQTENECAALANCAVFQTMPHLQTTPVSLRPLTCALHKTLRASRSPRLRADFQTVPHSQTMRSSKPRAASPAACVLTARLPLGQHTSNHACHANLPHQCSCGLLHLPPTTLTATASHCVVPRTHWLHEPAHPCASSLPLSLRGPPPSPRTTRRWGGASGQAINIDHLHVSATPYSGVVSGCG